MTRSRCGVMTENVVVEVPSWLSSVHDVREDIEDVVSLLAEVLSTTPRDLIDAETCLSVSKGGIAE